MLHKPGQGFVSPGYKFRSNSGLRLTGCLRQILPGVIAYGIQFDPDLYCRYAYPRCAAIAWICGVVSFWTV